MKSSKTQKRRQAYSRCDHVLSFAKLCLFPLHVYFHSCVSESWCTPWCLGEAPDRGILDGAQSRYVSGVKGYAYVLVSWLVHICLQLSSRTPLLCLILYAPALDTVLPHSCWALVIAIRQISWSRKTETCSVSALVDCDVVCVRACFAQVNILQTLISAIFWETLK